MHFFGDKTYKVRGRGGGGSTELVGTRRGEGVKGEHIVGGGGAPRHARGAWGGLCEKLMVNGIPPPLPPCPPPSQGGNDYEIFSSELTIGHTVVSPDDTRGQCTELFLQ